MSKTKLAAICYDDEHIEYLVIPASIDLEKERDEWIADMFVDGKFLPESRWTTFEDWLICERNARAATEEDISMADALSIWRNRHNR